MSAEYTQTLTHTNSHSDICQEQTDKPKPSVRMENCVCVCVPLFPKGSCIEYAHSWGPSKREPHTNALRAVEPTVDTVGDVCRMVKRGLEFAGPTRTRMRTRERGRGRICARGIRFGSAGLAGLLGGRCESMMIGIGFVFADPSLSFGSG